VLNGGASTHYISRIAEIIGGFSVTGSPVKPEKIKLFLVFYEKTFGY
jgi:hypothetical protein